ncbi:MAG: twin-arginine translocation signal domain-containing protein [Myxococcales bacterium]|nr:twin-arginine translocation signal domain-containing protein [Myxococcales bacterium]
MSLSQITRRQFLKACGAAVTVAATGVIGIRSAWAATLDYLDRRLAAAYQRDAGMPRRKSQDNPMVKKLYADYLEHPNSHRAHHLLHTNYADRSAALRKVLEKGWKPRS